MQRTIISSIVALIAGFAFVGHLQAQNNLSLTSTTYLRQTQQVSLLKTVYEVQAADDVPDVAYRVELRYLGEEDWITFSISHSEESAHQSVTWILLHLIAEARIVEFTPQLQWETVATVDSYATAVALANSLSSDDVHTRIVSKRVPRFTFSSNYSPIR